MIDFTKLYKALEILKPNVQWTLVDDTDETSLTEDLFNDIDWITGEDSNGIDSWKAKIKITKDKYPK